MKTGKEKDEAPYIVTCRTDRANEANMYGFVDYSGKGTFWQVLKRAGGLYGYLRT